MLVSRKTALPFTLFMVEGNVAWTCFLLGCKKVRRWKRKIIDTCFELRHRKFGTTLRGRQPRTGRRTDRNLSVHKGFVEKLIDRARAWISNQSTH